MAEIPLELRAEIVRELQAGKTIHAIKLYREATGADLRSAKSFVEQLQLALKSGSADSQGSGKGGALAPGMSDELLAEIVELLRTGAKIPAIKAYREAIPSSLKEAKDAVEEIERQYDIPKARSGCGATVLLCLASIWLILWFR